MKHEDELRLHAYLDGELGVTESIAFERSLGEDAGLRSQLAELRALRARIRSQASYHEAPAALREKLLARAHRQAAPQPRPLARWSVWLAAPALAAAVLLAAWFAPSLLPGFVMPDLRVQEAIDDHLRATLASHWVDVASSDRHTVKPWLSAKLGFSPSVPDLSEQGFELIGARIDVIASESVAALVYRRRQHVVSVFVWPGASAGTGALERRGYHIVRFERAGLAYWAVSDLNLSELQDLANLIAAS